MSFTQFIKPYPDGYEDFEVGGTPVTAEILNTNYDGFLLGLNEFLPELAGMVEANPSESATAGNLTKLKVGNSIYLIPSGGSGGSTVEWEQIQLTGTKIATITIDNVPIDVYAPSGGGSGDEVEWTQTIGSGTKIGTITINGNPTDVYAPTPIDIEANPSGSATAGDLTKLKVGSSIYSIPSGGSGGSGHTILDDDGTALAQEDDLQFKGVYSVDNSEDGVTEVNVYREMTKSEFDLLSSDEKKGFIRVTDEPDIYSDGKFQPVIYSLEEREIGVWTDGKPLYEKTIDCGILPNASTKDVAHNISNIDKIISIIGTAKRSDSNTFTPMPDLDASSGTTPNNYLRFWANITNIRIKTSFDRSNYTSSYATLRYTKTTDQPGSGSWTPQGVPTHKYSTEEHIIGTWIDGSTLYEKTYTGLNVDVAYNSWTNVVEVASDTDVLVDIKILSSNTEKHNITGSGIEYYLDKSAHYIKAEYNQNANRRNIGTITIQYTKSS